MPDTPLIPDPTTITVEYPTGVSDTLARVEVPSLTVWVTNGEHADLTRHLAMLIEEHGIAMVLLATVAGHVLVASRRQEREGS